MEDVETSRWEQLVNIEGVVVDQVEAEYSERGMFATLKCLGSHLSRKRIQFNSLQIQTEHKAKRLITSMLRVSVRLLL